MKKYIGFIILASLMLFVSIAQAEDNNSGGGESGENRGERKEMMDTFKLKREAFRGDMEAKRAAWRAEAKTFTEGLKADREAFLAKLKLEREAFKKENKEKRAGFCSAAGNMVTVKFEGAIAALEAFQVKTGAIIDKLKADGKDTTLATESLNLSKQKLAEAKAKLVTLKALVPADCTNLSSETFEKIKLGARETKDLLKESRESLHQVVKEIGALRGEDKDEEKDGDED